MKTKPILFQPEMVTAILERRKTQTTRMRLKVDSELWTAIVSLNVGGDILTILSEEEKTARLDRIAKELTFAGKEYILEIAKRISKC